MRRVHAVRIAVTAAVVLALTIAFSMDWAPVVGDDITRSASRGLGRSVTIAGPIRFRPTFRGLKGTATGIVIGSPQWARSNEFASIDAAAITFSWLPLLIGNLEPSHIRIKGALFELESRPAGSGQEATWHVGPLDPDRSPEENGVLRFRHLPNIRLEDAALAVTDAYGQLHDIPVRRFKLRRKGRGALASALLGDAEAPVKLGLSVSSLESLAADSSETALTIESDAGTVTASGKVGLLPAAGFNLKSHWELSDLAKFGGDFGLTGLPADVPLRADIRIAGSADAFAIQLDKLESERTRMHGVLQGRLVRQGGAGSAYNLLELTGEIASQHLDTTPVISAAMGEVPEGKDGKTAGSSLVDFLSGPGLVLKLDVEVSALELVVNDTIFKNASGRLMSDARLVRLSSLSGRLGEGSLALDLVMDRSGPAVQNVAVLFSGRDLDLGWLFDGLGTESLLLAPTDFAGELRAGGANLAEMASNLTGAAHFASGHGALRGAAAKGLAFSGVKLPRLEGSEALPLECLAGRVRFMDGIGVFDGFKMRGAGYEVTGQGFADLGRQMIDMRFRPVAEADVTRPDLSEGVTYRVSGPLNGPSVNRAQAAADGEAADGTGEDASDETSETAADGTGGDASGGTGGEAADGTAGSSNHPSETAARAAQGALELPPLRGKVARNNPCLTDMRPARTAGAAQGTSR